MEKIELLLLQEPIVQMKKPSVRRPRTEREREFREVERQQECSEPAQKRGGKKCIGTAWNSVCACVCV